MALVDHVYAYWKLNEDSGNIASDSSGNGRNGTLINMEDADWVAGKFNNCLRFNEGSTNEYVNCGNIAGFERTDSFSIEYWIKILGDSGTTVIRNIWKYTSIGYIVMVRDGKISAFISGGGANRIYVIGDTDIKDGNWHHIVVTYDGSSLASGTKIYTDSHLNTNTVINDNLISSIVNATPLKMCDGINSYFLNGYLDEVIIYNTELTPTEVLFRYNYTLPNAPSNPDPSDTATGIAYNQNLNWDADAGNTFDIYIGTGSPPSLVKSDHLSSDYTLGNLDSCTTYYWRIAAKTEWWDEALSPEWTFTTENELPIIPHTPIPSQCAVEQDLALTLEWDCEDYNPNDSLVYDIYFGTAFNPPLVKSNHATKSYNVSGLINDKKYYWKIIAKDNATCGAHETISPIWHFETKIMATGGYESFDPRKAYRDQLASLWNVNKDCDELEKCIYVRDSKGDKVYIPMYLSEEVKSEQLPDLPFLELETVETLYEPQDIGASTRKMSSLINLHLYFADLDNIDRTEFAKKIKDRLHDLSRYYQSSTVGIDFMNIESDTLVEETDGKRIVFHYIIVLYCLWYDICVEP